MAMEERHFVHFKYSQNEREDLKESFELDRALTLEQMEISSDFHWEILKTRSILSIN